MLFFRIITFFCAITVSFGLSANNIVDAIFTLKYDNYEAKKAAIDDELAKINSNLKSKHEAEEALNKVKDELKLRFMQNIPLARVQELQAFARQLANFLAGEKESKEAYVAAPEQSPAAQLWLQRLEQLDLTAHHMDEFAAEGKPIGGTGSGAFKKLHQKLNGTESFVINTTESLLDGEPAALEAYAGIMYNFLLGKHAPKTYFIEEKADEGTKLYAALAFDQTFQDVFAYHYDEEWNIKNQLLPAGSGLGAIIVASMLLGEMDLKAFSSQPSNLGVVDHNGAYYFKIDHGQSFAFNWVAYKDWFDLSQLSDNLAKSEYLRALGLLGPRFSLAQQHFDDITNAAREFAQIPVPILEKILDACEAQLAKLPNYPKAAPDKNYKGSQDNRIGGTQGVLTKEANTFKEAILDRFAQLRKIMSNRPLASP